MEVCEAVQINKYVIILLFVMNRNNLEWLGRATNWAKFTATASLGVIHKVGLIHIYQYMYHVFS